MKKLPLGVYAVSEAFLEGCVSFTFKNETYQATVGENAFPNLETLSEQPLLISDTPVCGYAGTPIVLIPSGVLHIGNAGKTKEERARTRFSQAITILGENAGISPNGTDLRTPALRAEESVIKSSFYFGSLHMKEYTSGCLTVDGFTFSAKIIDSRTGGENASLVVKNCIFDAPFCRHLLTVDENFVGTRSTAIIDCRADGLNSMGNDQSLLCVCSGSLEVTRLYMANTRKFLGMTDFSHSIYNNVTDVLVRDSLFENCSTRNGFTVNLPEAATAAIRVENCEFLHFTPENEPAIFVNLTGSSTLSVANTRFSGSNSVPAIMVNGNLDAVTVTDTTQEGFTCLYAAKPVRRTTVDPAAAYPVTDPHMPLEAPDFAPLDALYAQRQPYHGDFHCHSDSGGTSDGRTPLADYVPGMKELGVDFAAIVDHRQMRHYFLPEWDEQYLICGSEPGCNLNEPDRPSFARRMDYTMIFPDKTGLAQVMGAFPEFGFTGTWDGHFNYVGFSVAELRKLAEYIYNIGGLLSHAHPKQLMVSDDPLDYYISDLVPLETVHGDSSAFSTQQNRDLWVSLLKLGKRVRTHGSSDSHGPVSNRGLTTLYASRHFSTDIFNVVRSGDCTAGAVGIRMSIDSTPMGSVADYAEGKTLYIRLDDFHPAHKMPDTVYCLKVFTDQGLAYAKEFDGSPMSLAFPVEKRAYYRVEITNESDHLVVALSNPIWLDNV